MYWDPRTRGRLGAVMTAVRSVIAVITNDAMSEQLRCPENGQKNGCWSNQPEVVSLTHRRWHIQLTSRLVSWSSQAGIRKGEIHLSLGLHHMTGFAKRAHKFCNP